MPVATLSRKKFHFETVFRWARQICKQVNLTEISKWSDSNSHSVRKAGEKTTKPCQRPQIHIVTRSNSARTSKFSGNRLHQRWFRSRRGLRLKSAICRSLCNAKFQTYCMSIYLLSQSKGTKFSDNFFNVYCAN